jgi:rhodanese-related sulfurtransferase
VLIFLFTSMTLSGAGTASAARFARSAAEPQTPGAVEFITVEELKAKLEKGEAVTVIDVRGSSDLADSDSKIKGAIHVKLRRLKSRIYLPPLRDVSRNSEVVLYCACPNDEASIRGVEILLDSGFKRVHALKGGWVAWRRSGGQIESKPRG